MIHWPQYTLLALIVINLVLHSVLDGKPRTDKYSAGVSVVNAMLLVALLYAGGFWDGVLR